MKKIYFTILFVCLGLIGKSQVKIGDNPNTINSNSILELESTNKGVVIPRLTLNDVSTAAPLTAPILESTLIYNDSGSEPDGYYYWDGTKWIRLAATNSDLNDHDWYKVGTTSGPTSLTDNQFTHGNIGVGVINPLNKIDIQSASRTGTHSTGRPLYVTGNLGENNAGVEFVHSNGTAGIGFGYRSIYASGTNANSHLNLLPKGTGGVGIGIANPSVMLDVNGNLRVRTIGAGVASDQVLTADGNGYIRKRTLASIRDNLGDHTATQNVELNGNWLSGDGGNEGLFVSSTGNVGAGTATPVNKIDIQTVARTGVHPTGRPLYITGNIGATAGGVEIRHTNSAQGIGIGFNSIYAAGTNGSQHISILPKGAVGRVGIGTTLPTSFLDVEGDLRVRTIAAGAVSDQVLTTDVNGNIRKRTLASIRDNLGDHTATQNVELDGNWLSGDGGNEGLFVSTTGNIGAGTATPLNRLDVQSAARTGTHSTNRPLYVTGNLGENSAGVEFVHSNGSAGIGFGYRSIYASGTNANSHLNLLPKGTGGVGIGIANPGALLHVNGAGIIEDKLYIDDGDNSVPGSASFNPALEFRAQNGISTGYFGYQPNGKDIVIQNYVTNGGVSILSKATIFNLSTGKMHFVSGGNTSMTVNTNGCVGFGAGITNAQSSIHVLANGNANRSTGIRFSNQTIGRNWHMDVSSSGNLYFERNIGLAWSTVSFIAVNGTYTTSDRSLKENIKSFKGSSVLNRLMKLKPKTYNYINDEQKLSTIGFVAQDVQSIFPESVQEIEDKGILGIKYNDFGVISVAAIQEMKTDYDAQLKEQSKQIEELQQVVNELKVFINNKK